MASNKKSLLRTILTSRVGFGCGCGCSGQDPSEVFEPIPIPKIPIHNPNPRSSLTSSSTSGEPNGGFFSVDDDDFTFTSNTISEAETHERKTLKLIPKQSPKLMNSIAVEKDSEDPYKDFRHSMLQMIFEEEIFSETDLKDLLECFLQLNPPCHHEIIVRAFTQICEEAFPKKKMK